LFLFIGFNAVYLLVETLENSSLKIVRIDFTIISPSLQPSVIESPFLIELPSNLVGAPLTILEIDQGVVFFQQQYSNCSFVVRNVSSSELIFTLSNSLDPYEATQLFFSLSSYHCDVVRKISVKPGESIPIYIFFMPRRNELLARPSSSGGIPMQIHLRIDCRLVLDHTKTILFNASCYAPAFGVDRVNCDFSLEPNLLRPSLESAGSAAGSPTDSILSLPKQFIKLTNFSDAPLHYAIRNESQFFHIHSEFGSSDSILTGMLASKSICTFLISLNAANIIKKVFVFNAFI
jgi:hypothetical protein